jgi:predicted aminopeptidase
MRVERGYCGGRTPGRAVFSVLPPVCGALLFAFLLMSFSACYTLKQGAAMFSLLGRAVPLEKLDLSDEKTAQFVERVRDIRAFAVNELGLRDTKNYTRYVNIERDYLAAVVSACDAGRFKTYEWRFPIVGRVPYKGFFNIKDARKEADKLKAKGLDVWVRGVDAFSTLGFFRDPLYSYMRDYSVHELADLLIHELFHATVFIKNEVQFNEEVAEFVGSMGARLYVESRFGADSEELKAAARRKKENAGFAAFVKGVRAELDKIYSRDIPGEEKLRLKEECIAASKTRFAAGYETLFTSENYRFFEELPVNNAYFQLYALYYEGSSYLEEVYKRTGGNLPAFIEAVKKAKSRKALQN